VKRGFDVVVSGLVVLFTLPFWVVIMTAIRLETDGKAIFKQDRVGKDGRIFRIYKFRTMHSDTETFQYSPSRPDDQRITKVGKFLRKTSLDEFPQFLNVLKGEMSLVGPRPEMPFIVDKYKSWQRQRLKVKPGLTGLWQIMGRKELPLHESLEYDFYYIKNQSLLLDLTILIKTIPIILRGKGAY
jgi:lipopolysaccharide/colanic/teichoic acid biosynthesis glycosyltransferase